MDLTRDGAAHLPGAAARFLVRLEALLDRVPRARAGVRLHGLAGMSELLSSAALGSAPAARLGAAARPVRAILFDKTAVANWALGWHQDRTIAIATRADAPGFGPWSIKAGMPHVEPPFACSSA